MRQPQVDILDEGGSQVNDLTESTTVQVTSHVILTVLKENGHPRQFPSQGCHCLHKLQRTQPLWDQRHQEGLLQLPVLGAPLDCSEYLSRVLLGLSTERQQALNSLLVRGEGAADDRSMPSDVGLGIIHYFLL